MKKHKKKLLLLILAVIVAFLILFLRQSGNKSSGIIWEETETVSETQEMEYISVPCFSTLNFSSCSFSQPVEIYNPEDNNCYMDCQIIVDGSTVWYCNHLNPGYGFKEIDLSVILARGTYNATFKVRCFDLKTDEELNGCEINFLLFVS